MSREGKEKLSLESIRKTLVELEDTIIYNLINRAKLPLNHPAYAPNYVTNPFCFPPSLFHLLLIGSEAVQSQGGRYESPEEVPFLTDQLPPAVMHCSQDLPYPAASVNVSKNILDAYINQFLPLVAAKGDDGNYALSVSSDIAFLQVISRRIHYGKYVAEVKFRDATEVYTAAILAKDRDTLMKLLTDEKVEAMVKQRVEKKAMIFGQQVTINGSTSNKTYKVDPSLVSRLYDECIIPLTKQVEVEYLLLRLD